VRSFCDFVTVGVAVSAYFTCKSLVRGWNAACSTASVAIARHFTELIVWQLADRLRAEVFQLTKRRPFHSDLKLRSQIDDAADSVCRNIAEGFGGTDREFANFLRIARRSLNEVQDGFRSARLKEYAPTSDPRVRFCAGSFRRCRHYSGTWTAETAMTDRGAGKERLRTDRAVQLHRPRQPLRTDQYADRTDPAKPPRTDQYPDRTVIAQAARRS